MTATTGPIQTLLVATDFSDGGRLAVERAARLAADRGARLMVLHVLAGSMIASLREVFRPAVDVEARLVADAWASLDALVAELANRHGVTVSGDVRVGSVLDELLAAQARCDLLVLGAHGTSRLRDLLLGTMAKRLIYKATKPVLVVKAAATDDYRRALVPVDFSSASAAALGLAATLAPAAELHLLHAFDVPFEGKLRLAGVEEEEVLNYRVRARQQAQDHMTQLVARAGVDRARLTHGLAHGDAPLEIMNRMESLLPDLVAIGKQGQSPVTDLLLGSVTRHVLADAACDVLVVPPEATP